MIQVRTLSLFCDQQILQKVQSKYALFWEFRHLLHGCCFRSLAHKTNRSENSFIPTAGWCTSTECEARASFHCHCRTCGVCRSHTPRLGVISPLNCLNYCIWFYQGSCLIGFEWCVKHPAMCECVWLMIVVVRVCKNWVRSMGVGVDVWMCMCVGIRGRWARGICFLLW